MVHNVREDISRTKIQTTSHPDIYKLKQDWNLGGVEVRREDKLPI